MNPDVNQLRRRRRTSIDVAILFIIILLIVQMWLLSATLETYLAGHHDAALPGVILSFGLFAACYALYRFVVGTERPENDRP